MPRSPVLKIWVITLVAFIAGLLVSGTGVWQFERGRIKDRRQEVADLTSQVADNIHDSLNRSLSATYALAAVIRQNQGTINTFPQLAQEMLGLYSGITNLQIAPHGVIAEIFPLSGNEKAIGHNLLEDTKRNKEALLAVRTRNLTLAGPFDLIQGGKAVIGRLPVFLNNQNGAEYFWGFSNAMIRIPEFFQVVNVQQLTAKGYSYQISRIHPDSGAKDVFAASGALMRQPVSQKISVPNGEWTLAVEPVAGWYSAGTIATEAVFIMFFSSFSAFMVWWLVRQPVVLQQMVAARTAELSAANVHLQAEIQERQRTEEALQASEHKLRSIFRSLTEVILILDQEGRYVEIPVTNTDRLSRPANELLGMRLADVFPPEQADFFVAHIRQALAAGTALSVDYSLTIGDDLVWFTGNISPLTETTVVWSARDITQRKQAEEERLKLEKQLLHTQKLESLGVLAGGIAHDFNNILTAIIGNAELALMRLSQESPVIENLQRIESAAARAADLAKQMLAYSGKGRFVIEELDLNRLIEEMGHMLEVSTSKKALLRYNFHQSLPAITADATQIRQIVMNLVINASEAIGEKSGVIAITTGCQECDSPIRNEAWLAEPVQEGMYVFLEINDTGCGMDKETLARIFDPFFTTKFTGRGLGMAAVLGIVRGHKGAIKVYSEVGKGTTFKIMFPASLQIAETATAANDTGKHWRGSGKVLLVDDEETIRSLGSEMLRKLGYEVITAGDGRQALDIYRQRDDISLVLLDLTMPHMDGEQCFRELRELNPQVRVIMTSGFNEQEVTQKFVGKGLAGFIQKPYNLSTMRAVLMAHDSGLLPK